MSDKPNTPASGQRGRHAGRWVVASLASVAIAGLSAFAAGVGSKEADKITAAGTLSYSISRISQECGSGVFLPSNVASNLLRQPPPTHWTMIEKRPGSADFSQSVVQVAIQGESERTVTLTGIHFKVHRDMLPGGAVFNEPCGGPTVGRALVADLDVRPPRIVASSSNPEGIPGGIDSTGARIKPITFPWTVSLTDPLLLLVVAATDSCYCTWRAEIPWVSGSRGGTIVVDNKGSDFIVAGGKSLTSHYYLNGEWQASHISSLDPLSWSR